MLARRTRYLRLAEVSFSMKEKMSLMARGMIPRMSSLVFIGDSTPTCALPPYVGESTPTNARSMQLADDEHARCLPVASTLS